MARPTLQTGDIFTDALANAAGRPIPDGADEYGSGPKILDAYLDDGNDQIKSRFYGWYNRVQVAAGSGLSINYSGASVLLENGQQVALASGSITLPANSSVFVLITDTGEVTHTASLPASGIPLAKVSTDSITITSLVDLRLQSNEHVRSINSGTGGGFDVGDIKFSSRASPGAGWAWADNAIYSDADFPLAAAAIGRSNSLPGDPTGTFRTAAIMGGSSGSRVVIGASPEYPLGSVGGSNKVALTAATSFRHSHGVVNDQHSHVAVDTGHEHKTNEQPHGHPLLGSFEVSGGNTDSIISERAAVAGETGGEHGYTTENDSNNGQKLVLPQKTNVSIQRSKAEVRVSPASTGIVLGTSGESQPHENMQAFCAQNAFQRLE